MEDEFYIQLEDKYRGSRELIKDRLKVYFPILSLLKAIFPDNLAVDLGCGRGEWLELFRENDWHAVGIDLNQCMVDYCKESGFDAVNKDAIEYLQSLKTETISLITGFHIAEHLPFDSLLDLVKEAHRTLLPGGLLILETPNPENIMVGATNFYIDPTHLHPIPSQLLSFIPEYYGFHRTKILRLQEPPDLASSENMDLMNVLTDVSPDYAIIAQKNASVEILAVFDDEFGKDHGITLEVLSQKYDSQADAISHHLSREIDDVVTKVEGILSELNSIGVERERLTAELNGNRIDLQGLRTDLEVVRAERNRQQAELNNALIDSQGLRVDLEVVRAERDKLQTELQEFRVNLENSHIERDGLQAKFNEVCIDRDIIQSKLNDAQNKDELIQAELQHVYNSRSYRVTAPVRAVFGIARVWKEKLFRSKKQTATKFYSAANINSNVTLMGQDSIASLQPKSGNQPIEKPIVEPIQFGLAPNRSQISEELNLDEIMEKIREEVARSKSKNQNTALYSSNYVKETRLFLSIKKIQYILKKLPFYNQIYLIGIKFKPHISKYQEPLITAADLLKYDDEEFIKIAYRTILKREPDPGGYNNYLSLLRQGSLSKTQILGKLRYSPEGRQIGVKIKGLPFRFFY
jgi:O-antigen chain-terminating methyltransferase